MREKGWYETGSSLPLCCTGNRGVALVVAGTRQTQHATTHCHTQCDRSSPILGSTKLCRTYGCGAWAHRARWPQSPLLRFPSSRHSGLPGPVHPDALPKWRAAPLCATASPWGRPTASDKGERRILLLVHPACLSIHHHATTQPQPPITSCCQCHKHHHYHPLLLLLLLSPVRA